VDFSDTLIEQKNNTNQRKKKTKQMMLGTKAPSRKREGCGSKEN
jgi:hypothetical protein